MLLTITALAVLVLGLWQHDWRLILAGVSVATVWPLISADIYDDELDELWRDE
jgi:hypothetical protein